MSLIRDFLDHRDRVDESYIDQSDEEQKKSDKRLAFWIGICALGLAPGVVLIDNLFPAACWRSSISAYFYEPAAGPFFVVILSFVAAFLLRYRGENRWDGHLATAAGFLAFFVALVPTDLDGGFCRNANAEIDLRAAMTFTVEGDMLSTDSSTFDKHEAEDERHPLRVPAAHFRSWEWLHVSSAIALLLILFYFVTWAFPRIRESDKDKNGGLLPKKRTRNRYYRACTVMMLLAFAIVALDVVASDMIRGILPIPPVWLGEGLALFFFGFAWMVKGRFWFGWLDNESEVRPAV